MPRRGIFVFAALFSLAGGGPAFANAYNILGGLEPSRPEQACAAHADDFSTPGLWLGHFTGGRLTNAADGAKVLDWRDDYSCFPTAAACARWQHALLRAYDSQQGYRTCLPLRGSWHVHVVKRVRRRRVAVLHAKY